MIHPDRTLALAEQVRRAVYPPSLWRDHYERDIEPDLAYLREVESLAVERLESADWRRVLDALRNLKGLTRQLEEKPDRDPALLREAKADEQWIHDHLMGGVRMD